MNKQGHEHYVPADTAARMVLNGKTIVPLFASLPFTGSAKKLFVVGRAFSAGRWIRRGALGVPKEERPWRRISAYTSQPWAFSGSPFKASWNVRSHGWIKFLQQTALTLASHLRLAYSPQFAGKWRDYGMVGSNLHSSKETHALGSRNHFGPVKSQGCRSARPSRLSN